MYERWHGRSAATYRYRMVGNKPNQFFAYESPTPKHGWDFPEVNYDDTLEWCLPWVVLSEWRLGGMYSILRRLIEDGEYWNPITVWTLPDGSYRLWHGKTRYVWSKVFPHIKVDVIIIDHFGVDVTKRFPEAKGYSGENVTIDYERRDQGGKVVFKGRVRNDENEYRASDEKMFKVYYDLPYEDDFKLIEETKGVRYYHKGKFMFKWGNDNNSIDHHYDNIVDCMRFTCEQWGLL